MWFYIFAVFDQQNGEVADNESIPLVPLIPLLPSRPIEVRGEIRQKAFSQYLIILIYSLKNYVLVLFLPLASRK